MGNLLKLQAFKAAVKAGSVDSSASVRKESAAEVTTEKGKPIVMCISTPAVDRAGDSIAIEGWKLEAYQKNPVVLLGHRSGGLPIGKATRIWIDGQKLMAEIEFASAEVNPDAPRVEAALRGGFMSAASVGFRPIKYAYNEERGLWAMDFIEQELLEFSIVAVPCNAEALVESKDFDGEDDDLVERIAERVAAKLNAKQAPAPVAPTAPVSVEDVLKHIDIQKIAEAVKAARLRNQ